MSNKIPASMLALDQGTDPLRLPVWTEATKPPATPDGSFGFNSDLASFEGVAGGAWGPVGGGGGAGWELLTTQSQLVGAAINISNSPFFITMPNLVALSGASGASDWAALRRVTLLVRIRNLVFNAADFPTFAGNNDSNNDALGFTSNNGGTCHTVGLWNGATKNELVSSSRYFPAPLTVGRTVYPIVDTHISFERFNDANTYAFFDTVVQVDGNNLLRTFGSLYGSVRADIAPVLYFGSWNNGNPCTFDEISVYAKVLP